MAKLRNTTAGNISGFAREYWCLTVFNGYRLAGFRKS